MTAIRIDLYSLVSVWLAVHIFLFVHFGVSADLFDSKRYLTMAERFLQHGRFEAFDQVFYALPVFLLAFFKAVTTESITAFVILQCLLSGFATLCLYRAAAILFKDQNAGFFSAAFFLGWWDIIQWNTAVMTESISCSLICITILILVSFRDTLKDYAVLIFLLLLGMMTRPTGVLIVFGAGLFLISRHWNVLAPRPVLKAAVLSGFAVMVLMTALLMFQYWDFTEQYAQGNIVTYMDTIEGQPLYSDNLRLNTDDLALPDNEKPSAVKMLFFIWNNPIHFLNAAALKVFYLMSGVRPYFSRLHNAYEILWLSAMYVLFCFGYRSTGDPGIRSFAGAVIIANCTLIALSTVDWDNRFYMPMQPVIVLFAAGGGAHWLRRMSLKISH